jgi:hypothetical protein
VTTTTLFLDGWDEQSILGTGAPMRKVNLALTKALAELKPHPPPS